MEQYKEILTQLKNTTNILEYIGQRKKQCLEENQKKSKQNQNLLKKDRNMRIAINKMGVSRYIGISASSDFIEDDRKVVITRGIWESG